MKKLFLVFIFLCVAASAVERVLTVWTSRKEEFTGRTHGHILVMRGRGSKSPVIGHIRQETTSDDFPYSSYRNSKAYVLYLEGMGTLYMFPMQLVQKDEKGECMRGKGYILRDSSWRRDNEGTDWYRKKSDTWTSFIWSWRSLMWDAGNGSDPVWDGMLFMKEDQP